MELEDIKKPIEICLYIISETDKAFRVTDTGELDFEKTVWLPKSQVYLEQDAGPRDTVIFTMPEWLALDKGFI